jgi:uncharacterized membrane protein YkoI
MRPTFTVLASALALALALAGQVGASPPTNAPDSLGADWGQQQDEVKQGVRQRRLMPMGVVIEKIRRLNPGPRSQQLDAGLEYIGDRPVYRVRWITNNGRRIDYIVDAVTGQVLNGG